MGERSSEGYRASTLAGTAVKCGYLKKYGSNVEVSENDRGRVLVKPVGRGQGRD